jgi:hypothetical protein
MKTLTKTLLKKYNKKESKYLTILSAVAAMQGDLGLALHYLLKSKGVSIEGILYADLENVYVLKNNALLKFQTKTFKVSEYEG